MVPATLQPPSDNESLQADVMRFMAIIAFCLIAILALVRNVTPSPEEAVPAPVEPLVTAAPLREPQPLPPPAWQEPIEQPAEVARPEPSQRPAREQRRVDVDSLQARPAGRTVARTAPAETTDRTMPAAQAKPAESSAPETAAATPDESGLSLRFASDGDFLRLIARGDITVYAFNGTSVLSLTSAYDFLTTRSPGELYEVLPQTIPGLIFDALVRARQPEADSGAFSWGVTLPDRVRAQITSYLNANSTGELVIDRYGEVHHVAAN